MYTPLEADTVCHQVEPLRSVVPLRAVLESPDLLTLAPRLPGRSDLLEELAGGVAFVAADAAAPEGCLKHHSAEVSYV
jgi:hypothetical protein